MEPNRYEALNRQFSLASLLAFIFWLAFALGLTRLYPDTSDGYITTLTHALPIQCLLTFGIFVAIGGISGVVIGRRWMGLGLGVTIGMALTFIGGLLRLWWLAVASASV